MPSNFQITLDVKIKTKGRPQDVRYASKVDGNN